MTEKEIMLEDFCRMKYEEFMSELGCDENDSYRRGFKAGELVSALNIRHSLRNAENKDDQESKR